MKKLLIIILLSVLSINIFAPVISEEENRNTTGKFLYKLDQEHKQEEFEKFLGYLGYKESRNNWKVYNKYGYIGEYQFGRAALKATGYGHVTYSAFKKNPNVFPPEDQHIAVCKLIKLNLKHIGPILDQYKDTTINNIPVTKAGLIAAAHLGGAGSVKKYFDSGGRINPKDAYGTSIEDYLKEFSIFNIN